jgi:hypothetical protein
MKNIHLLPTDKPSRVFITKDEGLGFDNQMLENTELDCQNQHIYITNDEEIKEGDWWLNIKTNDVDKCTYKSEVSVYNSQKYQHIKKIILTTDQDLINDGVQAIDDKFLEWFVKNPSCEFVEVKGYMKKIGTETDDNGWREMDVLKQMYDIIIPKEEPKQETENLKNFKKLVSDEISPAMKDFIKEKQETLEEASETAWNLYEHVEGNLYSTSFKNGFKLGAEWQQERMYSEEEAGELVYNIIGEYAKQYGIMIDGAKLNDLFKQFKKK